MRVFLALMFAFMANAAAAQTPPPLTTAYETSWSPPDRRHDAEAVAWFMSGMKFEGEFKIWYLLGEPVVNCTARWTNSTGGFVSLRADDGVMTETAGDGEVEVYNLILTAAWPDPRDTSYGVGSARTIAVPCDAGVVAQNGRSGFNVAGSPSWDKFICALPDAGVRLKQPDDDVCRAMGGKWLDAASAREVARKGLIMSNRGGRALGPAERAHDDVSVSVLKGDVSGMAVMKRVEKRLWREKSAAFKLERSKAYFADFPPRAGEGAAERTTRRNDAMRRMPLLPSDNPSTDQLQAYEEAWQAVISERGYGAKLEKDWRNKEKALVGAQLKRLKQRDAAAAREEKQILSAFTELQARKKNEPKQIDPMAEYRTDTPLMAFQEGERCGLKRSDGSIAISGNYHRSHGGCPAQAVSGFDIYKAVFRRSHRALLNGGSLANDQNCSYDGCTIYYDRDGSILYKMGKVINPDTEEYRSNSDFAYGLITWSKHDKVYVYSLLSKKHLVDSSTEIFPNIDIYGPSYARSYVYVNSTVLLRNGLPALAIKHDNEYADKGCGRYDSSYFKPAYAYFYIDSEQIEEVGVCTNPVEDLLNEAVE